MFLLTGSNVVPSNKTTKTFYRGHYNSHLYKATLLIPPFSYFVTQFHRAKTFLTRICE